MKLLHHLATKANEILLGKATFATKHTKNGAGEITHLGFVITAPYAGPDKKKEKQKYELLFNLEEFEEIRAAMNKMAKRFDKDVLPEK